MQHHEFGDGQVVRGLLLRRDRADHFLPPSEEQVGLDVGLKVFAYLSTGEHIDNPRFFLQGNQGYYTNWYSIPG